MGKLTERTHPRQWFFDPARQNWVRNGSLVTDELKAVVGAMRTCRFHFMPKYRRLNRQYLALLDEYDAIRYGHIRSNKLLDGEVQVDASYQLKQFPNNPYLWKKKE